ncbi:MAG TPA: hypothetical protein VJK54_04440 [Chthoniobacterales bacterium]|nr:hypothetical protein [Chthoniobacterales bacterium]
MKFFLIASSALILLTVVTGCETTNSSGSSTTAIPWNKPASWEGSGVLGAMGFQGSH